MYHPRLKGTHYQMGLHYGEILHKSGKTLEDVLNLPPEQIAFAEECFPIYEKYMPDVVDEMKGLADGLCQSREKIYAWLMSLYCFESQHGCSVFAVNSNDGVLFGRNMDMFPEYKKTSESVLYMPEGKNIFVGHSTSMVLMEDGMNDKGLSVALTFLLSKNIKPGINGGFIVRHLLEECNTAKEALDVLETLPVSSTNNIIIADKTGEMAVCECCCRNKKIRKSKDFVIATNHFIDDDMVKYNADESNWYKTNDRYNCIEKCLTDSKVSFDSAKEILSGKYGFVCQYEKSLHFDTIWSCVYNLNTLYNEICEGNPSKCRFKEDNRLLWGISKRK